MKKKASSIALEYIKEKIFTQEWKVGEKISSEPELENEIGVSRSSIRSAVEQLVALSILIKKPGDGTYVNKIGSETLAEIFIPIMSMKNISYHDILQCRMALDVLALELSINQFTDDDIFFLEEINTSMEIEKDNNSDFIDLDFKFHDFITKKSNNNMLPLINELFFTLLRSFSKDEYYTPSVEERVLHHRKLLKAIKIKNRDLAISYVKSNYIETILSLK